MAFVDFLQFSAPHLKAPSAVLAAQNSMSLLSVTSADGLPSYWPGRKRTRDPSNQKHHPLPTTFLLPLVLPGRPLYNTTPLLRIIGPPMDVAWGVVIKVTNMEEGCRELIVGL